MSIYAPRALLTYMRYSNKKLSNGLGIFYNITESMAPIEFWTTTTFYPMKYFAAAFSTFQVTHDKNFFADHLDSMLKVLWLCMSIMSYVNICIFYKIGGLVGVFFALPICTFGYEIFVAAGILMRCKLAPSISITIPMIGSYFGYLFVVSSLAYLYRHLHVKDRRGKNFIFLLKGLSNINEKSALKVFDSFFQALGEYVLVPFVEGLTVGAIVASIANEIASEYKVNLQESILEVDLWLLVYGLLPVMLFVNVIGSIFFLGGSYEKLLREYLASK